MGDSPAQTRASRRPFWLWTTFLTCCALLGLGKPIYELHWKNRETLFVEAHVREQASRERMRGEVSIVPAIAGGV